MPATVSPFSYICARCLRAQARLSIRNDRSRRTFTRTAVSPLSAGRPRRAEDSRKNDTITKKEEQEEGAMSRRLADMSDSALEQGGRSAQKAVEEAGFDNELKERLLNRIADANFKNENASAIAQANLPSSAGKGTRDIAGAAAWTGSESLEDAALRMLNDSAPRPIRTPFKAPTPRGMPIKIETGQKKAGPGSGTRLANARDRASSYSYLKDPALSPEEREKFRKELKQRFTSGAATGMPATITGLQSLANERIEDAIARGQFKNLPRGKKIERDYNMSSPFLDTTEYFMNKIIQKQDIVPPWIEKQQELVSTATKFRGRLRNDWKRHAARMIAAQGGSLQSQIQKAEWYAQAEAIVNPGRRKVESINTVGADGQVSQITLAGELKGADTGKMEDAKEAITVTESAPAPVEEAAPSSPFPPSAATSTSTLSTETGDASNPAAEAPPENPYTQNGYVTPFRDPTWEANELSYHKLVIENLNTLTRSYNLMAPKIAQKTYFFLDRELLACYRDVAPLIAGEIAERARAPPLKARVQTVKHKQGGILEKFGGEHAVVYDSEKPNYGFKEMWRDLFAKK